MKTKAVKARTRKTVNTEQVSGNRGQVTGNRLRVTAAHRLPLWNQRVMQTAAAFVVILLLLSHSTFAGKDKDLQKHYGLIFGTAYGPDDRPLYGVKIEIHPAAQKHPAWELMSDHRGEFAQRVPPGPGDYLITGQVEYVPVESGVVQMKKKKKLRAETKVHIEAEERQDVSLHFRE